MSNNWIMIADDDLEDQEMLTEAIGEIDKTISVKTASDGRQALQMIAGLADENLPTLLVLDYKMPYMNAAEVLEMLAKEGRYSRFPKVVWSTSHRQEDVNRCLDAGARDYFVKPSLARELRAIANQMLDYCNTTDHAGK